MILSLWYNPPSHKPHRPPPPPPSPPLIVNCLAFADGLLQLMWPEGAGRMRDLQHKVCVNAKTQVQSHPNMCTHMHNDSTPPFSPTPLSALLAASLSCLSLGQTGDCVSPCAKQQQKQQQNEKHQTQSLPRNKSHTERE